MKEETNSAPTIPVGPTVFVLNEQLPILTIPAGSLRPGERVILTLLTREPSGAEQWLIERSESP